jgi:hypothetical protein
MPYYNGSFLATMIDERHNIPSGYDTWSQYLDRLLYIRDHPAEHPNGHSAHFRLAQRLIEASYYTNLEAEGNLPTFVFDSPQPNVDAPSTDADMPQVKQRTILEILYFIRKNKKTLTPRSHCWKWLHTAWQKYVTDQRSHGWAHPREHASIPSITNFLALVNKYIKPVEGGHLVLCNHPTLKFIPENMVLRFWYLGANGDLKANYSSSYTREIMINHHGYVEKNGELYTQDCFVDLWYEDERKVCDYTSLTLVDPKTQDNCNSCRRHWVKGFIKYSPRTEKETCPICTKAFNKPHTDRYVFGEYHARRDRWNFFIARKDNETSIPMGIEIEMQNKYTNDETRDPHQASWAIYQAQLAHNPNWHEFYTERDGSLAAGGLELVSNPMTLEFAQEYWGKMLPEVRKHCVGWNVFKYNGGADNSYGIHITVSKKYLTNYQIGRLYKFFEHKGNQLFLQCIAQRIYNYSSGLLADGTKYFLQGNVGYAKGKLGCSTNRYSSMNIKQEHVEFRLFASTLNEVSFMKNYEFIDAMWHWVKETAFSTSHHDFLNWLSNKPRAIKRYPNLFLYLNKDAFYVRIKGPKAVKYDNTFKKDFAFKLKGALVIPTEAVPTDDPNYLQDIEQCV